MKVFWIIFSALLAFPGGAHSGSETHGGDALRFLFLDARKSAASDLSLVGACSFDGVPVSGRARNWILKNKDKMIQDILGTPHHWIETRQRTCSRTQGFPQATLVLSYESCREEGVSSEKALQLVIQESTRHLGVTEESFIGEIADGVIQADKMMGCGVGNGSGKNLGVQESVIYSETGELLVTYNHTDGFKVWDSKTGNLITQIQDSKYRPIRYRDPDISPGYAPSFSVSPNGKYLSAYFIGNSSRDRDGFELVVWDLQSGKVVLSKRFFGLNGGMTSDWSWSPDDRRFFFRYWAYALGNPKRGAGCYFDLNDGKEYCPSFVKGLQAIPPDKFTEDGQYAIYQDCQRNVVPAYLKYDFSTQKVTPLVVSTSEYGCFKNALSVIWNGSAYTHFYRSANHSSDLSIYSTVDNGLLHRMKIPLGRGVFLLKSAGGHGKVILFRSLDPAHQKKNNFQIWLPGKNDGNLDEVEFQGFLGLNRRQNQWTISQQGERIAYQEGSELIVRDILAQKELVRIKVRRNLRKVRFIGNDYLSFVDRGFVLRTVKLN